MCQVYDAQDWLDGNWINERKDRCIGEGVAELQCMTHAQLDMFLVLGGPYSFSTKDIAINAKALKEQQESEKKKKKEKRKKKNPFTCNLLHIDACSVI